jgi:phosphoglycerol transferase MdoB-like AlkP superfamily enzyme
VPLWLDLDYEIVVTADHGMNGDGHHGGTADIERDVPFYYLGAGDGPNGREVLDQLAVAPTILSRIGVDPPPFNARRADLSLTPIARNQMPQQRNKPEKDGR